MPPSPTLFSTPRLLILENFASLPVYWFMCTVDSNSMKPRQSRKTICCTCCFIHIAQNCFLITMKHDVVWRGETSKRTRDSLCRYKLPLYFLYSFCWYFQKIVWWFYVNEIPNCCFFASLSAYSNLPVY